MKKWLSLLTIVLAGGCSPAFALVPSYSYTTDVNSVLSARTIRHVQGSSQTVNWRFVQSSSAWDLTGASTVYFRYGPSDNLWGQTVTGSLVSVTNGTVIFSLTPANTATNGTYPFNLRVSDGASNVLCRAYGDLILLPEAGAGSYSFPTGTNIDLIGVVFLNYPWITTVELPVETANRIAGDLAGSNNVSAQITAHNTNDTAHADIRASLTNATDAVARAAASNALAVAQAEGIFTAWLGPDEQATEIPIGVRALSFGTELVRYYAGEGLVFLSDVGGPALSVRNPAFPAQADIFIYRPGTNALTDAGMLDIGPSLQKAEEALQPDGDGSGLTGLTQSQIPFAVVTNDTRVLNFTNATVRVRNPVGGYEAANARWVRGLFAGGDFYYSSTNEHPANPDCFAYSSSNSPVSAFITYTAPTNGEWIGCVMTTNRSLIVHSPAVVNTHLRQTGLGGDAISVNAYIFYSYDGTNWLGGYKEESKPVEGETDLYSWVISFPKIVATNATGVYIARRLRVDSTESSPDLHVYHGGATPSSINFDTPVASDVTALSIGAITNIAVNGVTGTVVNGLASVTIPVGMASFTNTTFGWFDGTLTGSNGVYVTKLGTNYWITFP